jgi:hypothetical protein
VMRLLEERQKNTVVGSVKAEKRRPASPARHAAESQAPRSP